MAHTPTQLPSLRWQGAYKLGRSGKRVTRTFDTYGEAQEWAEQAEAEDRAAAQGSPDLVAIATPSDTLTVSEHGQRLLRLKATLARATLDNYASALRGIQTTDMAQRVMATTTRTQVQEWVNRMDAEGIGRPTINARLRVLRMIFRHAVADRLITFDATRGVKFLPETIRQDGNLDAAQVQALLDHATPEQAAMVLLATDAGLRWQEMAGLPASAVMLSTDFLIIRQVVERNSRTVRGYPKGKEPRVVPIATQRLSDALAPLVEAARATDNPDALLFTNGAGKPLGYHNWLRDQWFPLRLSAELGALVYHDLRHTYGSTLAAAGVPIHEIQKLMGHASQSTTERYIHAGTDGHRLALVREALGA